MKTNKTFMLMSCVGIVMVVDCHTQNTLQIVYTCFPYNSFFISLFIFISGYFTKCLFSESLISIKKALVFECGGVKKDFVRQMVPYYVYNVIYGIVVNMLIKCGYIYFDALPFTFYNVFFAPFFSGIQFVFNGPGWFLPILFLTKVTYRIIFLLVDRIEISEKNKDYSLLCVFLVIASICILSAQAQNYEYGSIHAEINVALLVQKIGFFIFFYHSGKCFRLYYENFVKSLNSFYRISICVILNLSLLWIYGHGIEYGSVFTMGGFGNAPFWVPFIVSFTGIVFWYTICDSLVDLLGNSKICNMISDNTDHIMYNHVMIFNIINWVIIIMMRLGVMKYDVDFIESVKHNAYAMYEPVSNIKVVYVITSVVFSVIIGNTVKKLKILYKG